MNCIMKILIVCLGNICRSPIAHGIFEKKIKEKNLDWEVDSAGTSGWHDGEGPDQRAINICKQNGIDISNQISRKLVTSDLNYYDLILTMDSSNFQDIFKICVDEIQKSKVKLIMNYTYPDQNLAVPDPYFDGNFKAVFNQLNEAIDDLIASFVWF